MGRGTPIRKGRGAGDLAQWQSAYLGSARPWVQSPAPKKKNQKKKKRKRKERGGGSGMFARKPGKGITLEMYIRNTQVNKIKSLTFLQP